MKYFYKKSASVLLHSMLALGLISNVSYAAETVCNDNGGAGWAITDGGITNLPITFNFGDASVIHDVNISTDITHTWIGDLTAKVTSPESGTQVRLFERPGTAAPDSAPASVGPWGCNQNNIVATFDDDNPPSTINIENECPPTNSPYLTDDPALDLSTYNGEDPNGDWNFYLSDSANGDTGRLNQACLIVSYAAVGFDKWVSTNNTCSDTLDTLSVAPGTDVYFCYTAYNPSTETFTINPGDTSDSQGHNISALETTYIQNASQTVIDGPSVAGTDLPVGTTINNAQVTATFSTPNYTGTLSAAKTATVIVGDPVFTTSTKTVVDLNGGSAEAGDVLEYTVTINESAGFYTPNVQLTDVVDANLSGITFTTLPAGSTNNTVGNNIDISGITLPASGTETIVFEVTIGGAVASGTSIDNTAVISHTDSGVTFNAIAPTVVVSSTPPASGTKQLYFDTLNTTPNLTRVPPGGNTQTGNIDTLIVNQGLVFQAPFSITDGNTVNVQLRMRRRNGNTARTIQAQIVNGSTGVVYGTGSAPLNQNNWRTVNVPVNVTNADFLAGEFIRVIVDNIPATNGNIQVATLRNGIRSEVQMQTSTVINVDSIGVYAAAYPATTQFSSYEPGSTVYIRTTVSDPFGSADITSANITITDSAPAVQINNAAMSVVDPSPTGATRIFEYSYVIPATPDGFWNISVTATEGLEAVPITHTAQSTMIVGTPTITISKNSAVLSDPINASNPKAIPSSIVEYTVAVENSGFGYVDSGTTVITDPLDPNTTYYFGSPLNPATFVDGTPASGLTFTFIDLASTIDDIDFSNDGGATYITPTVDANGFDTSSPPINYIRVNPKGEFTGSDGTNNPSMEIKFRVRVE